MNRPASALVMKGELVKIVQVNEDSIRFEAYPVPKEGDRERPWYGNERSFKLYYEGVEENE